MAQRICLAPNVWLTVVQSNKFKTGCFSVNFLRPLRRSEAALNALIPGVLLGGTQIHPDIRSISIRLDELYGASVGAAIRKKGETQVVGLYADCIEDDIVSEPIFSPLCAFVSELLFSPLTEGESFCTSIFDTERVNLVNSMRMILNDKQAYANQKLMRLMFATEPYSIPYQGEEQDLKGVSSRDLYAQYRRLLENSRVEVFYLGRKAPDMAAEMFHGMLKDLPRHACDPLTQTEQNKPTDIRFAEEAIQAEQSKLSIGCRAVAAKDPELLASMLVFSVIYGAGSGSKLFRKVREERSLCYYANAVYDKFKGFLRINSGISQEHYEEAKDEILNQLALCAEGAFSNEELKTAKRLLVSQLRADMDSPSRLDEFYIGEAARNGTMTVQELIDAVERVQPDDVQKAAATVAVDTAFLLKGVGA